MQKMMLKNKQVLIPLIVLLSILILFLTTFLLYQMNLQPVSKTSHTVLFKVESGDSISRVIERMEDEKLIKNGFVAKVYAKLNGLHNLKAGSFTIDTSWNTAEILSHLNSADNAGQDQVKVTFREGIWAKDIAKQLEESLGIPTEEWLTLWNDSEYIKRLIKQYEFLDENLLKKDLKVKLEGFLYPETYYFSKSASKEEITSVFLDQFKSVYDSLKTKIQASDMGIYDIITLASMVQFESKSVEDMKLISGVFHNRLKIQMPLGSSVTICYALYDKYKNAEDCELNTRIESPYNTYIHAGLPVGPILNPGLDAILATIQPKENDYLYFMADIYGDGKVYYSKTQEEHDKYVQKYLRK